MPNGSSSQVIREYVLEGRVVTMGPQGVLPNGAIYVEGGVIRHVLPAADPSPAGSEDAPHIRTGDSDSQR